MKDATLVIQGAYFVSQALLSIPWVAADAGQDLHRMMLLKDILAGIGVSTVNKVWPGLCLQIRISYQTK